jgi:MFS family permease
VATNNQAASLDLKMNGARIPRVVWLLGIVSLCMDLSSEMVHSLLPVFLVSTLGAGALTVGLIEGIAEGTASIAKVFSGVLSDRFERRKPLVLAGYGLAAVSKPLFPLAQSAAWVLVARFADRIGKGVRGAPRDALVADVTPAEVRGAAYGLRQSLDTAGALLGPLAAIGLMSLLAGDIRKVFWFAVLPALAAVALLAVGLHEPAKHVEKKDRTALPRWRELNRYASDFWVVVVVGAIVTMARFSEAFLVLRTSDAGLVPKLIPLVFVVMNLTYVVSAYPAGWLSDRAGRVGLLTLGMVVLLAADFVLGIATSLTPLFVAIALWGFHMGLTQGLFAALVADTAPAELRGSAFGVFNFVSGVVAVFSSLLAGALWKWHGPRLTFYSGAAFSLVALAGLTWMWRHARPTSAETIDQGARHD